MSDNKDKSKGTPSQEGHKDRVPLQEDRGTGIGRGWIGDREKVQGNVIRDTLPPPPPSDRKG